jgi:hypothetical protein
VEFESPHPAAASPPGSCHKAVVTKDGPHPPGELRTVAARWERRRSRRPCHPHAIRSGQERYPAVSHGHFEGPMGWTHIPDLGWGRRSKLHGMQGVTCMTTPMAGLNLEASARIDSSQSLTHIPSRTTARMQ